MHGQFLHFALIFHVRLRVRVTCARLRAVDVRSQDTIRCLRSLISAHIVRCSVQSAHAQDICARPGRAERAFRDVAATARGARRNRAPTRHRTPMQCPLVTVQELSCLHLDDDGGAAWLGTRRASGVRASSLCLYGSDAGATLAPRRGLLSLTGTRVRVGRVASKPAKAGYRARRGATTYMQ
ncbi:hypothetical protein BV25DRAFT_942644 [Artomyces pyxidatus]|uniref:Uncharacterized protein n=1 Tax=Artomyces pyxidatus TaxID=48021 RepID=A0ACB8SXI4_9AGAM|nr:hypothetical protein BV25DRAFT_942644 [Artomyces pyxidatus]